MINNVVIVGRLVKDIELRTTSNGISTTSFTLAVGRTFKKEGQPDADFIQCVAWKKTAELMYAYLHRGSMVGIVGRIQTRKYEDRNTGNMVYVTEVVADSVQFLDSKEVNENSGVQNNYNEPTQVQEVVVDINSDELPF